jgi:hypothetical protein
MGNINVNQCTSIIVDKLRDFINLLQISEQVDETLTIHQGNDNDYPASEKCLSGIEFKRCLKAKLKLQTYKPTIHSCPTMTDDIVLTRKIVDRLKLGRQEQEISFREM